MEWDDLDAGATPQQRKALYVRLVGVDPDRLRDLIRSMTSAEASAVLDVLAAADRRSRVLVGA